MAYDPVNQMWDRLLPRNPRAIYAATTPEDVFIPYQYYDNTTYLTKDEAAARFMWIFRSPELKMRLSNWGGPACRGPVIRAINSVRILKGKYENLHVEAIYLWEGLPRVEAFEIHREIDLDIFLNY